MCSGCVESLARERRYWESRVSIAVFKPHQPQKHPDIIRIEHTVLAKIDAFIARDKSLDKERDVEEIDTIIFVEIGWVETAWNTKTQTKCASKRTGCATKDNLIM